MIYHYDEKDYIDVSTFSPEGKVMGLSAYGKMPDAEPPYLFSNDKRWNVDECEFKPPWVNFYGYDDVFKKLDGHSADDIAYFTQQHFEDALVKLVTALREDYLRNNCFAGGCFLNVCTNSLLRPLFKNVHIPPYPMTQVYILVLHAAYKTKRL